MKAITLSDYDVLMAGQYMPLDLSSIMGFTNYQLSYTVCCIDTCRRDSEDIVIKISRKADSFV